MTNDQLEQQRRERTRRDIIREAEAWATEFGGLDERTLPLEMQKAPEPDEHVDPKTGKRSAEFDKNGFPNYDTRGLGGTNPIKQWIKSIDDGTISNAEAAELALETKNPRLIHDHIDRQAEAVSQAFVSSHPEYGAWESNFKSMIAEVCEMAGLPGMHETKQERDALMKKLCSMGLWTLPNLNQAYANLQAAGEIEYNDDYMQPLSEPQKARIKAELAMGGDEQQALLDYLSYSIGVHPIHFEMECKKRYGSAAKFMAENEALTQQAASFIFYCTDRTGFSPTTERLEWLRDWCGSRFVTVALLRQGWAALQKLEAQQATYEDRRALLYDHDEQEPPQVNEAQLEDLNDQQLDDLYKRTLRAIHDQRGKARGIY